MTYIFDISWPGRALSPNGGRVHWTAKKRYKAEAYGAALAAGVRQSDRASISVVFHPKPNGKAPDRDNCISSFKMGQDGIAAALHIDDGEITVTHTLSTERTGCVRVTVVTNG